jgi:hypothetical protein
MEIRDEHVEWASVDRMRQMLVSVRRDFEITQTYTLFAGILCWTLQRIRSPREEADPISVLMHPLRRELEAQAFTDFLPMRLRLSTTHTGRNGEPAATFNRFEAFEQEGVGFHALRALIAGGRLEGYRLSCVERDGVSVAWCAEVNLNRAGMVGVADSLATRFCEAIARSEPGALPVEAAAIRERASA